MKVKINVECTPEEARSFLGLPDVAPLQQEMMDSWKAQMDKAAKAMNPEDVMKTVFPVGTDGLADMQKAFWSSMTNNMTGNPGPSKKK
ncbi:MAG: DUF6489 family protein [Rhodospirillaceae bacterium]|jgi:hypothetical protein